MFAPEHWAFVAFGSHSSIMLPPIAVEISLSGGAVLPAASNWSVSASA